MTIGVAAINLLVIFSIAFAAAKKRSELLAPYYWPALLFRLAAGIGLGLLYQHYYPVGDTFTLFHQASELTNVFWQNPAGYFDALWNSGAADYKGELRSAFFVKIISLVNIISYNNYWITGLWFSFAAFWCSWKLFRTILAYFPQSGSAAALGFLFLPSAIVWSSGIIKESLALGGLFLLAATWLDAMHGKKPRLGEILLDLLGFWILWKLKYYWAAVFLPVALASLVVKISGSSAERFSLKALAVWAAAILTLGFGIRFVHPNFYPGYFLTVLVDNHNAFVELSESRNLIHYHHLEPTWGSVLLNSPWALFSGLFRPLPGESSGVLALLAGVENLLLIVLTASAFFGRRSELSIPRILVISVASYAVVLCIFLALSTPNFGSLARYKAGFTPFFVFLVAYRNPLMAWSVSQFKKLKNG